MNGNLFVATLVAFGSTALSVQAQVPIELVDGVPVINVQFGGEERVLILDTGAGVTVLDTKSAEGLDLEFVQDVKVSGGTEARSSGRLYRTRPVTIGDVTIERGLVLVLDLSDRGGPFRSGIDGVFSPRLGEPHLIEVDFPNLRLKLLSPANVPTGQAVPYTEGTGGGLPRMKVTVDGVMHPAVIDSGAPSLLLLPSAFIRHLSFVDSVSERGRARTVNDDNPVLEGMLDGAVTIAGKTYDSPTLEFVEGQEHIIVGMEALRELTLTLDPANRRAWVDRH